MIKNFIGNGLVKNSELKDSLNQILKNCPFLINVDIDYGCVNDDIFDLRTQVIKNAGNFSKIVQSLIFNNKVEQLKSLFQDILILKCLDSFMGEYYEYAVNTNSLFCLNVLLNISTVHNHTQEIAELAEKVRNTSPMAFQLLRCYLFNTTRKNTAFNDMEYLGYTEHKYPFALGL